MTIYIINTEHLKFFEEPITCYSAHKRFKISYMGVWKMARKYMDQGLIKLVKTEPFHKGIEKKFYQLTDKGRKIIELLENSVEGENVK